MIYDRKGFEFDDFEITKSEILASITIVAIMVMVGILISSKIQEHKMDKNEIYNKAVKIEDGDQFEYGMETNVGNAFVYGKLKAVDPVTYPEVGGKYMYVKKVKEKYTMHTRRVAHTRTVNGHTSTYYTTETYWSWDAVGSESVACKKILFCGVNFTSDKIKRPGAEYIKTINESQIIRYKYYGTGEKFMGTIFAELKGKTIPKDTAFYKDKKIEETVDYLETDFNNGIFWFFWIILIVVVVFVFYYLDNKWLK